MKKLLLVLTLAFAAVDGMAARPVPKSAEEPRRNVIAMTGGLVLDAFHMRFGLYLNAEYARNIQGKLWIGGRLIQERNVFIAHPVSPNVVLDYWLTTAYGLAYWEFPVAGRWLSFRVGGGVGLGLHYDSDMNRPGVGPYFMVNAQWVIHISRGFGLTLAPLIAGPWAFSQLEWAPFSPSTATSTEMACKVDILGHIGLYVKF